MESTTKRLIAAAMLVSSLLSACQPVQPPVASTDAVSAEIPVVTLKVTNAGLEAPTEMPSGVVAVTVEGGDPENQPMLARLSEGVTVDQLTEALASPNPLAALQLVSLLGGSNASADEPVIHELQAGGYVAMLFAPEGPPQVLPIVAGAPSGAAPPIADVKVSLVDFNFVMPDRVAAGRQVWQIENTGEQWHEMAIVQLNEGKTVDDVVAWVNSSGPEGTGEPPPFAEGALWHPMGAGQRAWVTWDIPAGEYTVICILPDVAGDMSPHVAHGMVRTLVVE